MIIFLLRGAVADSVLDVGSSSSSMDWTAAPNRLKTVFTPSKPRLVSETTNPRGISYFRPFSKFAVK